MIAIKSDDEVTFVPLDEDMMGVVFKTQVSGSLEEIYRHPGIADMILCDLRVSILIRKPGTSDDTWENGLHASWDHLRSLGLTTDTREKPPMRELLPATNEGQLISVDSSCVIVRTNLELLNIRPEDLMSTGINLVRVGSQAVVLASNSEWATALDWTHTDWMDAEGPTQPEFMLGFSRALRILQKGGYLIGDESKMEILRL